MNGTQWCEFSDECYQGSRAIGSSTKRKEMQLNSSSMFSPNFACGLHFINHNECKFRALVLDLCLLSGITCSFRSVTAKCKQLTTFQSFKTFISVKPFISIHCRNEETNTDKHWRKVREVVKIKMKCAWLMNCNFHLIERSNQIRTPLTIDLNFIARIAVAEFSISNYNNWLLPNVNRRIK